MLRGRINPYPADVQVVAAPVVLDVQNGGVGPGPGEDLGCDRSVFGSPVRKLPSAGDDLASKRERVCAVEDHLFSGEGRMMGPGHSEQSGSGSSSVGGHDPRIEVDISAGAARLEVLPAQVPSEGEMGIIPG